MKILVGLGNPGAKYEGNRHNVGFMAIDAIAHRYGVTQWRKKFHGLSAEIDINRTRYLLLKPMTYMNESGRAVGDAARFYKTSPADVIVFHDELDLEPGKIKAKFGGGHAGHNGLKSITAHIGNDYQRVRIGIGHPGHRDLVSHYVLTDFDRADRQWLEPLMDAVAKAVPHLVVGDDPKFLNEIARATRPAPAAAKAKTAGSATSDTIAAASAPAPQKLEPAVETAAAAAEPPKPAFEPAMAAAEPPKPAAPVANTPSQFATPAAANEAANSAELGLGNKLRKWFGRG